MELTVGAILEGKVKSADVSPVATALPDSAIVFPHPAKTDAVNMPKRIIDPVLLIFIRFFLLSFIFERLPQYRDSLCNYTNALLNAVTHRLLHPLHRLRQTHLLLPQTHHLRHRQTLRIYQERSCSSSLL